MKTIAVPGDSPKVLARAQGTLADGRHRRGPTRATAVESHPNVERHDVRMGHPALHAPVQRIDGSGANPYENFVVLRNRLFEVFYFKDLSGFAFGVNGGFHVG